METAVIAIAAVVSVCVTLYLFALSQVSFLKKNWPKYRCHPLYMPMAGMVGQDVAANFTKCTMKGFHDYAGFIMDPIMSQFSTYKNELPTWVNKKIFKCRRHVRFPDFIHAN